MFIAIEGYNIRNDVTLHGLSKIQNHKHPYTYHDKEKVGHIILQT